MEDVVRVEEHGKATYSPGHRSMLVANASQSWMYSPTKEPRSVSSKAVAVGDLAILAATAGTLELGILVRAALVGVFVLLTSTIGANALARLESARRDAEASPCNRPRVTPDG